MDGKTTGITIGGIITALAILLKIILVLRHPEGATALGIIGLILFSLAAPVLLWLGFEYLQLRRLIAQTRREASETPPAKVPEHKQTIYCPQCTRSMSVPRGRGFLTLHVRPAKQTLTYLPEA